MIKVKKCVPVSPFAIINTDMFEKLSSYVLSLVDRRSSPHGFIVKITLLA